MLQPKIIVDGHDLTLYLDRAVFDVRVARTLAHGMKIRTSSLVRVNGNTTGVEIELEIPPLATHVVADINGNAMVVLNRPRSTEKLQDFEFILNGKKTSPLDVAPPIAHWREDTAHHMLTFSPSLGDLLAAHSVNPNAKVIRPPQQTGAIPGIVMQKWKDRHAERDDAGDGKLEPFPCFDAEGRPLIPVTVPRRVREILHSIGQQLEEAHMLGWFIGADYESNKPPAMRNNRYLVRAQPHLQNHYNKKPIEPKGVEIRIDINKGPFYE